jgi:hypothetical protein
VPVALVLALLAAEPGYEDHLVSWALETKGRTLEPAPEGKRIEEIVIAQEDVFAPEDPYPRALNIFHQRTREEVIRQEVIVAPGEPWSAEKMAEQERNLRNLFFLAVARVVPVRGQAGGVGVLIVTRDRWSFRLSNAFTLIGPLLEYLQLTLVEVNFNGRGQSLAGTMIMHLDTVSLGQTFLEPRLLGSMLSFGETASILVNRATGKPEGTAGGVSFGLPLRTLDQLWSYSLDGNWNVLTRRVYRGASIWQLKYPDDSGTETVPDVYGVRELALQARVTRRFGSSVKWETSAALGGSSNRYAPPASVTEPQRSWLIAGYLPRSEDATWASLFLRAYSADYRVLHDLETYQLSEDHQIGWRLLAGVKGAFPTFTGTAAFLQLGASLRYHAVWGDDFLSAAVAGGVRLRPDGPPANQRLVAEVVNFSPRFYGGRFVTRFETDLIQNDLDHRQLFVGGSSGLRGTYPEQFSGRNTLLANFEYRAQPFEVLRTWVGLAFFYDVGSAWDVSPALTHTVGFGLRILFPQLNRLVLRVDFAAVLNGPMPGFDRLNASWGQVTEYYPDFVDNPLP